MITFDAPVVFALAPLVAAAVWAAAVWARRARIRRAAAWSESTARIARSASRLGAPALGLAAGLAAVALSGPRWGEERIVTETRGLNTKPFNPNFKGGWIFYGSEGIIAGESLFDLEGKLVRTFEGRSESHFGNFLKGVRSRNIAELHADILEGHQSTALCHIGNISYRLGRQASSGEVEKQLGQLKVHDDVLKTFERTRKHLLENDVDLDKSKLTLGPLLRVDSDKETFADNLVADSLLTREYRKPFVLPTVKEV